MSKFSGRMGVDSVLFLSVLDRITFEPRTPGVGKRLLSAAGDVVWGLQAWGDKCPYFDENTPLAMYSYLYADLLPENMYFGDASEWQQLGFYLASKYCTQDAVFLHSSCDLSMVDMAWTLN